MNKPIARTMWIDNLRSFLTVLVVAHHSSLAYTTFAKFNKTTYINSTAPVVDHERWIGMDIFVNFNDIFFMSLMFMISGLFFYRGIYKKGRRKFLADRFMRLGLPFAVAVTLIIPLAYFPSFYLAEHNKNIAFFIKDFIVHQQWPVGPPWFIWILLVFNLVTAIIPLNFYRSVHKVAMKFAQKPFTFFIVFFIIASLAYIPISLWIGHYTWTGFGPFDFQLNRILLYFMFFLFGSCIGSADWENHIFTGTKLLNKSSTFWVVLCLLCYSAIITFTVVAPGLVKTGQIGSNMANFIFGLLFVASCISSSLAFIAFFHNKLNKAGKWWSSLSANAYGIYLVHYVFVTWIQFVLLNIPIPVIFKFLIVFLGALLLSWLIIYWIKKIDWANRLI